MRRYIGCSVGLFVASQLCCVSCKSVDRFDTGPNGAFCGEMISGGTSDGLIPDGSAIDLKLALTLSSQQLKDYPGRLTSNDVTGGLCEGTRLFDDAKIRTVQKALLDSIATVQITPDHEQDLFTWVDSSCQGTFLAILSLMYDGTTEIRLFKPMHEADAGAPASQRDGFGVFSLTRSDTGCGF